MRRWLAPLVLLVAALGGLLTLQITQSRNGAGYPAPDFALPSLDGRMYQLSALRGKVVFLNLWTTWCPPCRTEMPSMEELHRRLGGEGLVVLAVSEDVKGREVVAPFVEQLELSFPVLLDPEGRLSVRYGATGYPETFIIDPRGYVVEHHIGPDDWSRPERIEQFLALLGGGAESERVVPR